MSDARLQLPAKKFVHNAPEECKDISVSFKKTSWLEDNKLILSLGGNNFEKNVFSEKKNWIGQFGQSQQDKYQRINYDMNMSN